MLHWLIVLTKGPSFDICFSCFRAILSQAYLLLGDEEYLYIFNEAYKAAMKYLHNDPWYLCLFIILFIVMMCDFE